MTRRPRITTRTWRTILAALTVPLIAIPAARAQGKPATPAADMERIVRRFYELRARTLDERGTAQDVAALADLLAEDVAYEHPRANVTMTKAEALAGIKAHLGEGRNARVTIRTVTMGRDAATVELTLQYDVPETKTIRGASIFEFAFGKIRRIAEY
jgi:ketosteroid isomerase-like protein